MTKRILALALVLCMLLSMAAFTPGADMELICTTPEHGHSEACWETRLVCTKPETTQPHAHDDGCGTAAPYACGMEDGDTHTHGDGCYVLTANCGKTESDGHGHTDDCYMGPCATEENHVHGDTCYAKEQMLNCEEDHEHAPACYLNVANKTNLECTTEENHVHSAECAVKGDALTCGQEESAGHKHDDTCRVIACGQEEHTHGAGCYTAIDSHDNDNGDDNSGNDNSDNGDDNNADDNSSGDNNGDDNADDEDNTHANGNVDYSDKSLYAQFLLCETGEDVLALMLRHEDSEELFSLTEAQVDEIIALSGKLPYAYEETRPALTEQLQALKDGVSGLPGFGWGTTGGLTAGELYEAMLAAERCEDIVLLIEENMDAAWALTGQQVDGLEAKAKELLAAGDDEDYYENVMASVEALRDELNGVCDFCGTPNGEHTDNCSGNSTQDTGTYATTTGIDYTEFNTVTRTFEARRYEGTVNQVVDANASGQPNKTYVWTTGWYYVPPTDTVVNVIGHIQIQGDVKLVIADGVTLNVSDGIGVPAPSNLKGVSQFENSLTIYTQANHTGTLHAKAETLANLPIPGFDANDSTAHGSVGNAAIGGTWVGNDGAHCGSGPITIHGGTIIADSRRAENIQGTHAAGIGSSLYGDAGPINIYDANVTAYGARWSSGIGGGGGGDATTITFINSTVYAEGDGYGAGIGGGGKGELNNTTVDGGVIRVIGGAITAVGGYPPEDTGMNLGYAYGIGNGRTTDGQPATKPANQASVIISDGAVIRTTDINVTESDDLEIKDAVVFTKTDASQAPAGEVSPNGVVYGKPTLTEDFTLGSGEKLEIPPGTSITIPTDSTFTNQGTITGGGTINVNENATLNNDGTISSDGVLNVDGDYIHNGDTYIDNGSVKDDVLLDGSLNTHVIVNVYYFDENGNKQGPQKAVVLNEAMLRQDDQKKWYLPPGNYGWYYINGKTGASLQNPSLEFENRFYVTDGTNSQNEHVETKLILGNNSFFLAKHGIDVSVQNAGDTSNALTIYQEVPDGDNSNSQVGVLHAEGTGGGTDTFMTAGIGGGDWRYSHSGEINIYGGTIELLFSDQCANIGSGINGQAGPITIKNAKITSGDAGAAASIGAGAGDQSSITSITIDNSIVLATSNEGFNGIGDDTSDAGTLTISNSVVFTDKIGPASPTYSNSLLFTCTKDGPAHGELKGGSAVELALPLVIPQGSTLTIKNGETLTFNPDGSGLFNNVRFDNQGTIYRDFGSVFTPGTVNVNEGTQIYEILNEIKKSDGVTLAGTTVTGNSTFHSKMYAADGTTITVTSEADTRLDMDTENSITSVSKGTVTQGAAENIQILTMPASPVKLTGNVFEYFDLVIEKTAANGVTIPDGTVFVFNVQGSGTDVDVRIVWGQNNNKATVKHLFYGDYTVTEETGWNREYAPVENNIIANFANQTVRFENGKNPGGQKWLEGSHAVRNLFDGKTVEQKSA